MMVGTYDPWLVLLSLGVASLAALAAFDLAGRVRHADAQVARWWLAGGAVALGTGIWSMHFIGMLAFSLPIPLGYEIELTALSWVVAVAVSWLALRITGQPQVTARTLVLGALAMGAGICGMHYLGMYAMRMVPAITYDPFWLAVSALIAVGASGAAIVLVVSLRADEHVLKATLRRALAAVVMGLAITGMHFSGMAAAQFSADAICISATSIAPSWLALTVALAALAVIALSMTVSALDARLQSRTQRLAVSLRKANQELHRQSMQDGVTGLPNRRFLERQLELAVAHAGVSCEGLALLVVDLDGFKLVNDELGHAAGDHVLTVTAQRLLATVRKGDVVARVGADEFVALLPGVTRQAEVVPVLQRMLGRLREPITLDAQDVLLSASIGAALHSHVPEAAQLLSCADAAMQEAKRAGRNQYRFFDAAMSSSADGVLAIVRDLHRAVERGELRLHYQPKVSAADGRVTGVEALVRWQHPTRGLVSPAEFIPVAERFGLIQAIGEWVIDEACRAAARLAATGARVPIAVNLSAQQLHHASLPSLVQRALDRHDLAPALVMFEITESCAMEDPERFLDVVAALRRLGAGVAIDDFGTGYSSLAQLRQLPVVQLKLDRSFIVDVESSEQSRSIVDAVVRLAHAVGLRVVAEGVETAGQHRLLAQLQADELQGYLFARPMPFEQLVEHLERRGALPARSAVAAAADAVRAGGDAVDPVGDTAVCRV